MLRAARPRGGGRQPDKRGTATARGYSKRWSRAAASYRRQHPTCVHCEQQGRVTAAECVDHIIPHDGDSQLFWDARNWQSLCWACHNRKTWSDRNGLEK